MSKSLSYGDAIRLLGGQDSKIVTALDQISGGILLGATPAIPALLGWFDAKAELVRLSHSLVRGLSERRNGLSRYSRTQRLEAAHAILVIIAYFETLEEADLPFRFSDLELTKAEQVGVAGGGSALTSDTAALVDALLSAGAMLPEPQCPHEDMLGMLCDYYRDLSGAVLKFIGGLNVWDRLAESERERFTQTLDAMPQRARDRYEDLFRQLAADFPEVEFWANLKDHEATRGEVRRIGTSLADLERMLAGISTGSAPDERRAGLARAYQAALQRPIVEAGDAPAGLRIPTLGKAYVAPRFRAATLYGGERPSDESWWADRPIRADLEDFLVGHLTSPQAARAPLLVLGQPGSGKSVLTRVLAARLPAADFLPVRVELRTVPAVADLQDHIEHAIRDATGERLDWPAFVRSAGDALPVILLDGFDELLQATGVSQSDYLARVAKFQQREADQGRAAAVVVTSRTSVADRARVPDGTVALRLEPFDGDRVTAWVATWNATNAAHFSESGLAPLEPEVVMSHRDLAEQPLLLLMLALYDADGNALRRIEADLRRSDLYEQLLRSFARREVAKHGP